MINRHLPNERSRLRHYKVMHVSMLRSRGGRQGGYRGGGGSFGHQAQVPSSADDPAHGSSPAYPQAELHDMFAEASQFADSLSRSLPDSGPKSTPSYPYSGTADPSYHSYQPQYQSGPQQADFYTQEERPKLNPFAPRSSTPSSSFALERSSPVSSFAPQSSTPSSSFNPRSSTPSSSFTPQSSAPSTSFAPQSSSSSMPHSSEPCYLYKPTHTPSAPGYSSPAQSFQSSPFESQPMSPPTYSYNPTGAPFGQPSQPAVSGSYSLQSPENTVQFVSSQPGEPQPVVLPHGAWSVTSPDGLGSPPPEAGGFLQDATTAGQDEVAAAPPPPPPPPPPPLPQASPSWKPTHTSENPDQVTIPPGETGINCPI